MAAYTQSMPWTGSTAFEKEHSSLTLTSCGPSKGSKPVKCFMDFADTINQDLWLAWPRPECSAMPSWQSWSLLLQPDYIKMETQTDCLRNWHTFHTHMGTAQH